MCPEGRWSKCMLKYCHWNLIKTKAIFDLLYFKQMPTRHSAVTRCSNNKLLLWKIWKTTSTSLRSMKSISLNQSLWNVCAASKSLHKFDFWMQRRDLSCTIITYLLYDVFYLITIQKNPGVQICWLIIILLHIQTSNAINP